MLLLGAVSLLESIRTTSVIEVADHRVYNLKFRSLSETICFPNPTFSTNSLAPCGKPLSRAEERTALHKRYEIICKLFFAFAANGWNDGRRRSTCIGL
ncbi:hypothetical protein SAMN04488092_11771 [Thalassovita taeanensis]|uniref:Uncharacterized protein n=1 Tax=Thalassovita taeanensis TaxID=657014 RepID=A0A1H9K849_9RHOB|nr:hypothetical protein SAMN04488092_11771 [Thalassovita taeanensis]